MEPQTSISYGRRFTTKQRTVVATVPVGYADGYPRHLYHRASVLVNGQRAKIIGRVCMDQLMVNVTDIPGVKEGDTVTLFGHDGDAFLSVDELAGYNHTISYELVCLLSKRVPRIYYRGGEAGRRAGLSLLRKWQIRISKWRSKGKTGFCPVFPFSLGVRQCALERRLRHLKAMQYQKEILDRCG